MSFRARRSRIIASKLRLSLAALLVITACARSTPGEHELVSEAQDETRTFFALGEAGNCDKLAAMMQRPETCKDLTRQFLESHTHLTKVVSAKLDGRDKETVLVSVEAQEKTTVHEWIVRAKWTKQGWKFAL